jgi:glyoxylase-like metal-dependent hydrolase (beta-lactamase superfamily II)
MIHLHQFIFNDFQENTYVIWDETNECVIIDAGCYYENERNDLKKFIEGKNLKPVLLLNTHCHLDHVFGNKWVKETFQIPYYAHTDDLFLLHGMMTTARLYGFQIDLSPDPDHSLTEGEEVKFGNSSLKVLHTPGHSPGSVSLYSESNGFVIGGDVLFNGSIGRVDLPGGNYETLMQNITTKLLTLPEETKVYSGHGTVTTIGAEKRMNPFVLEYEAEMKVK